MKSDGDSFRQDFLVLGPVPILPSCLPRPVLLPTRPSDNGRLISSVRRVCGDVRVTEGYVGVYVRVSGYGSRCPVTTGRPLLD